jgi:hypothetical protein
MEFVVIFRRKRWWCAYLIFLLGPVSVLISSVPTAAADHQGTDWPFPIAAHQRPGTYFWCPGSAFTREDIDWNLEQLHSAGFGFVHIIPIYGARGAESRFIQFLEPRWVEMLDYTVRRAKARDMFVDMTTGTGWCFGGPDLPPWAIDTRVQFDAASGTIRLVPGMRVKRAAPGGEGPMLNPFSPRAMEFYLERFSTALADPQLALPRAQYHDSFEYQSNWCDELFEEFQNRCGYDLRKYLPTFFDELNSEEGDLRARLKCDYRGVLAELHLEYIRRWSDWAHARGMLTRNQAHGAPANLIDVYAASDIPETEMFGAPDFPIPGFRRDPAMCRPGDCDERICMLASSAAHVAHPSGKQLISAEACTWLREHWHTSLAHIKLQVDLFFLTGVNQLLFHGTCFSPKDAPWPGWFFYASVHMDWRNAFWRDVPALTQYVARCQSILQAGQHANDVLVYWPIYDLWMDPKGLTIPLTVHRRDWMEHQPVGDIARFLLDWGFAFDFVSDRLLAQLTWESGVIRAPGGTYRAIVIPACTYMPEKTLQKLIELLEAGAPVIFEEKLPDDVPGLACLEERRTRFKNLLSRIPPRTVVARDNLTAALGAAGALRESMAQLGLRFVRRKVGENYWYFVVNHTAKPVDAWIPLAVPFASVTIFDPLTGRSGTLACRQRFPTAEAYLQLEPGQAVFLRTDPFPSEGPLWPYFQVAGDEIPLTGTWSIDFIEGGPELPRSYRSDQLTSWTEAPDPRAQAFAGTARYTLEFTKPPLSVDDWYLDLGDVRESARVKLNGEDLGILVAIPFKLRVGAFLREGTNRLEIEVTNLSANRIRDLDLRKVDWKIMKDINIVNVNYRPFDASQWPVEKSGLLGPVRLIPLWRLKP